MSRAFLREVHVEVGAGARGGERAQVDVDTHRHVDNGASLSLSHSPSLPRDACNPYYEHPGAG
jgi:hypothetical protein